MATLEHEQNILFLTLKPPILQIEHLFYAIYRL